MFHSGTAPEVSQFSQAPINALTRTTERKAQNTDCLHLVVNLQKNLGLQKIGTSEEITTQLLLIGPILIVVLQESNISTCRHQTTPAPNPSYSAIPTVDSGQFPDTVTSFALGPKAEHATRNNA